MISQIIYWYCFCLSGSSYTHDDVSNTHGYERWRSRSCLALRIRHIVPQWTSYQTCSIK